jgi:hypothetical protein
MLEQLSEQPSPRESSALLELEEQIKDYEQKREVFRETNRKWRTNTDPESRVNLKAASDDRYKELKELYRDIETLCKQTNREIEELCKETNSKSTLKHPTLFYLEEQVRNRNQKFEEFRETSKGRYKTTDPSNKAQLKGTEDALRKELEERDGEIEGLCEKNNIKIEEFCKEIDTTVPVKPLKSYEESLPRCKPRTVALTSLGITGNCSALAASGIGVGEV